MQIEIFSDSSPQAVVEETPLWGWRMVAGSRAVVAYGAGYCSPETARVAGAQMLGTWAAAASDSPQQLEA